MEMGAWGHSESASSIWSYLTLTICLILMYLQVKICKLLCLYIAFLRFLNTNCPFTFCVFQTKLNKVVKIFVDYQNESEMYK